MIRFFRSLNEGCLVKENQMKGEIFSEKTKGKILKKIAKIVVNNSIYFQLRVNNLIF